MRSLRYLWRCAIKTLLLQGRDCPSCGGKGGAVIDRKYLVTSLRRCTECDLLFRTPTTSEAENASFYQEEYEESVTTDLPRYDELQRLKLDNFAAISTSYLGYIDVVRALTGFTNGRVLDYGCSWGYGSFQLRQAGYTVDGFEISKVREAYARNELGVNTLALDRLEPNSLDVFLSCHVIEHVPSVASLISLAEMSLRPNGWFIAFTPNGCLSRRNKYPKEWHRNWGGVHPQLIDDVFVHSLGRTKRCVLATHPYDIDSLRTRKAQYSEKNLDGYELMIAFQKS